MLKTRFVYGNNEALFEISSAHNFDAPVIVHIYEKNINVGVCIFFRWLIPSSKIIITFITLCQQEM